MSKYRALRGGSHLEGPGLPHTAERLRSVPYRRSRVSSFRLVIRRRKP